ncbi:MAG: hypothetical protein ACJAQ3_001362, partial [Planctomycetota bacterium]
SAELSELAAPAGLLQGAIRDLPVLYDDAAEPGRILSAGQGWKADFGPSGLDYTPVLGQSAAVDQVTSFELRAVTVGGEAFAFEPGDVSRAGDSVTLDRGSMREVYHLDTKTVEQTFVFDELPSAGDLVVEVGVKSPWAVQADDASIRFVDPSFGEISYGKAFVVDANGQSVGIAREWVDGGIVLTVPAFFLAKATFPVTIDPPIGLARSFGAFADLAEAPDSAYDAGSDKYWFVFEVDVSASNTDVRCVAVRADGTGGVGILIDSGPQNVGQPSIAMAPLIRRGAVAVSGIVFGNQRDILTFGLDLDTHARDAQAELVSNSGSDSYSSPQISGNFRGDQGVNGAWEFFVIWRSTAPGSSRIEGVFKEAYIGTALLPVTVANSGGDIAPAISKSRGSIGAWHVAWIVDPNSDFKGQPFTRSYDSLGQPFTPVGLHVSTLSSASKVSVTSSFVEPLSANQGGAGVAPYIVSFDSSTPGAMGIHAAVCDIESGFGSIWVSAMEDFDQSLIRSSPSIATDGYSFFLSYAERDIGGSSIETTLYMTSGQIVPSIVSISPPGPRLALSERHTRISADPNSDGQSRGEITTRYDGGGDRGRAMIIWEEGPPVDTTLYIRELLSGTVDPINMPAVGVQYCDANGHASSGVGGRNSSWLSIHGPGEVIEPHTLYCQDMQPNAFSFFITSMNYGNANLPGGSAGRLCLSGNIGRRVGGVLASSGSEGAITASFSPQVLPTPTGVTAALPGETWFFQCWHRDIAGGQATSNFSNACWLTFEP